MGSFKFLYREAILMRSVLVFSFIFLSVARYCYGQSDSNQPSGDDSFETLLQAKNSSFIGKLFPSFTVYVNGKKNSNEELTGKVTFINFWFAACPPCIAEMFALNKLYRHFRKHKNFKFISFTFENAATIAMIRKKYRIHYTIISITSDECYRLNNNNAFPTSIILNSRGIVTYLHLTGELNKVAIRKYFTDKIYQTLDKEIAL